MQMYSIFDRKMREYGNVVLANNDAHVLRQLKDGVRGSATLMEKYPADFDLFHVGEFDITTGVVTPASVPALIINLEEALANA